MVRSWLGDNPLPHYNSHFKTVGDRRFYSDPVMDKLADDALGIADPVRHVEALEKLYVYIHENAMAFNLYAVVDNHALGPMVDWRYPPGLPTRLDWITWR